MAFKIALFAALCVAQVLAYKPSLEAYARNVVCHNPSQEITQAFEEAVNAFDDIRDSVNMVALDAYARDSSNLDVIFACFKAQKKNMQQLGGRITGMIKEASRQLGTQMKDTAEKYAKLMEVPLRNIVVTMRELPDKLYQHLVNLEFLQAGEEIIKARKTVMENGKIVGDLMQQMAAEVPEMAQKAEEMARQIRIESKKGSQAIRAEIAKCVEEGGPQPSE